MVHPCCNMCQGFLPFKAEYCSIVHIYQILFVHSFANRYLGFFYLLAVLINAYEDGCINMSLRPLLSILRVIYPEVGLLDDMVFCV